MAYFKKVDSGWICQVQIGSQRVSKTLPTKAAAQAWAAEQRIELHRYRNITPSKIKTFDDLCDKYATERSVKKKGARWEGVRLTAMSKHKLLCGVPLAKLTPTLLSKWRDDRLGEVKGSSVLRDIHLMNSMFNVAVREWCCMVSNPLTGLERPKEPPGRDRLITDAEITKMLAQLEWDEEPAKTKTQVVAVLFLFALSTGMRCGEILSLKPEDINGRVARLHNTKNGHPRDVPLSRRALELLSYLPGDTERLFDLTGPVLDALFRRNRKRAGLEGFTLHDCRHHFITAVASSGRVSVLELSRIVGHQNLNQLNRYFNKKADDLAALLD